MGDWQFYGAGWSPEKTGTWGMALVQGIACDMELANEGPCGQTVKTGRVSALPILTQYLQTYRRNSTDLVERSQYFY